MIKALCLGISIISLNAFASYTGPLLSKTTATGYVAPGYRTYTHCEIYSNKIVLTQSAEGIQSIQTKNYTLNGNLIQAIEEASKGPVREEVAPVDGPSRVYKAKKVLTNGSIEVVDLATDTGGNGKKTENQSPAARGLRNFLDMNCK